MKCCCRLRGQQAAVAVAVAVGLGEEAQEKRPSPSPEQPVYLKPSRSRRRKASFLFTRMRDEPPAYAFKAPPLGTALPLFRITSSSCEYYALRLPLLKAGFRRLPTQAGLTIPSNLLWGRSMLLNPGMGASHSSAHLSPSSPPCSSSSSRLPQTADASADLIALPMSSAAGNEGVARLSLAQMVCDHQRFNHFPRSHINVGCKWGLTTRLRQVSKSFEAAGEKTRLYDFFPRTWVYPDEKEELLKALAEAPPMQRFIWKPARGSCGHGILTCLGGARNAPYWERLAAEIENRLLTDLTLSGAGGRKYVVQEYIEDPLLLDRRKTDLRLYVAVTSYDPLTVYLHEEGLVRLAAQEYSGGGTELNFDPFRDLTNYSVGRRWQARGKQSRSQGEEEANLSPDVSPAAKPLPPLELKKSLNELWEHIDAMHFSSPRVGPATATPLSSLLHRRRSEKVKEEIARVIIKTLLAVKAPLSAAACGLSFPGGFFELYGFDLMLDAKLKPWLVEVNTLPSLASTSPFDYAVKTNVVADLLNLAMFEPFERPASCFGALDDGMRRAGLLDPLSKEAAETVHQWCDRTSRDSPSLTDSEAREEVGLRLQDELAYCGGFRRIFPPLPLAQTTTMMNEVDVFSRQRHFSKADAWALES
ncbi:putative tubulin-tyrosine ligase-like protein [Trypanosoma conorhini]|uniref:Putative tubulin-tyrosine ligase-like protein n=1 Tax=Trypanosoma conorhini TaxID=83891 RepID=A0A3R7LKF0_9TRYP|nr:putative tubulin-tyrosine ligase-like protein [Trypanosoma conorhini]RNF26408.1 putative tubulin-tyrosine ligase-like protein [Trypanosoma conorhini]